jgi:hypothetical protein
MNVIGSMNCGPDCPGCQEADCTQCDDDFNRANNSDIDAGSPCGWQVDQGSFSIVSNRLQVDSADSIAKSLAASSEDTYFKATTVNQVDGDVIWAMVDYTDEDNHLLIAQDTDICSFYDVVAGTATLIKDLAVTNAPGSIAGIWYDSVRERLVVSVASDTIVLLRQVTSPTIALGVGSKVTATLAFDNFSIRTVDPTIDTDLGDCIPLPEHCAQCADPRRAVNQAQVVITFGGSFNGTYVCDLVGEPGFNTWGGFEACVWEYELPSAIGSYNWVYIITFSSGGPTSAFWRVQFSQNRNGYGGGANARWNSTVSGSALDCEGASNVLCSAEGGTGASGSARVTML